MKVLKEAAGSPVSPSAIKLIKKAGYIAVGTDCNSDSFGRFICDEFYQVPYASDPGSAQFLKNLVIDNKIDLVVPTLDEGMIDWAKMSDELKKHDVFVAISDLKTIEICQDKWLTYNMFIENDIPTPDTSLENIYPLVKPRNGRGSQGITINDKTVDMTGMISQELLKGLEYTIDVLCDKDGEPVYIVPRVRTTIKEGKSTEGIVVENKQITELVKKICKAIRFKGPINIQCFECEDGQIKFTEINPRLGGGTVLGIEATENWFPLIVDTFVYDKKIKAEKEVQYGLKMSRYYDEVFYF